MYENQEKPEVALLAAVDTGEYDVEASIAELYELTQSAGAEPFGSMVQKRPAANASTCVGSGFLKDMADYCKNYEIDLLVFDCELTPTQLRNIEKETAVHTVDRTMLILDIFAKRALSKEGRLQVELAQLKYMLPRLSGQGTALSRLGGGIGTRGPGETKLETDKRHIRRRIATLREKLDEVETRRELSHARRKKDGVISAAIVGYTNAGKSTLMNYLTEANVLAEDMLFATLDPTARALKLPHGNEIMLVDTVGLVRRLPHQLVEAFKSTLEEAVEADVILNICDASSPEAQIHLEVTRSLLGELGCTAPVISVLNKCDVLPSLNDLPMIGDAVRISAKTGLGVDRLLLKIEETLALGYERMTVVIPFDKSALAVKIRHDCPVQKEVYVETGLEITADFPPELAQSVRLYQVQK